MTMLDDMGRLQLAAMLAGLSVVDFQLRMIENFIGPSVPSPRLRLVSDLHGIMIDPEFIKARRVICKALAVDL